MSKKSVPTDAELLAQFDDLNVGEGTVDNSSSTEPQGAPEQDVLAELQNLASQRPASRPSTPQSKRTSTNTPPADRTSDEKTSSRKSGDSTRPYHMSMTPADTTSSEAGSTPITPDPQAKGSGGGWWGGFFATASAAMKQAEAAVKEIQKNEEAQKWAEHVRGNVGMLKGLGGELKTLALPTFTSFIHTLAPPISSHERLQIHITHDLRGYPSLDSLIYNVFARVMAQVEGGDLLVVQRGQESGPRRGPESGASLKPTAGWNDGPWWRYVSPKQPRSISAIKGAVVATKLARASAEAYANEFYAARGGVEEAARQASEILSESNPVRNSDIFLSIQALSQPVSSELFQAGPSGESEPTSEVVEPKADIEEEISFAVYLHDPVHGIAFHTISQSIPQRWIEWLDASAPETDTDDSSEAAQFFVPEAIAEIIESGGVDPREWVAEWVEDALTLGVGVIAQRYVARRMGVGEGGVGKGKMKVEQATVVESGAGEAARAI
ncbi:hypothetical protein D8B26_003931 [Coccidioides posadasii str. Silveira]|uniref:Maintenance of telomere capping protein 1 n=1 Tax=Coccidioides posadasii (strain C735) TaxID=222929 RepID=C5P1F7_COCP7|nr:hypothetical protein CPC735_071970 [Coccidioides posadasii C735 delta SOWgp]EER29515.1 hypothetical protein CPC735_071970 [Coccidioides posadasii C735 delta SOWgp]QVM09267.1 hypothetical protein D8B26_003931 [Coccidioides posadasii str. Silveira]|eukprot:XP_003071660.1 hypothetical protein CPC735_071970 [Coccidioides posadasii C735 delta SOWgp]